MLDPPPHCSAVVQSRGGAPSAPVPAQLNHNLVRLDEGLARGPVPTRHDYLESTMPLTVRYPKRPLTPRLAEHVASIPNVTTGDPVRVPVDAPTVDVHLDGSRVKIPVSWSLAFSSKNGRDILYAREETGALHVLVVGEDGALREFYGLTEALVSDILAWRFS